MSDELPVSQREHEARCPYTPDLGDGPTVTQVCRCDLIRLVQADEREAAKRHALVTETWAEGFAAGRRFAAADIAELRGTRGRFWKEGEGWLIRRDDAIQTALGGLAPDHHIPDPPEFDLNHDINLDEKH